MPPEKRFDRKFDVWLSREQLEKLARLAQESGKTKASVLRALIDNRQIRPLLDHTRFLEIVSVAGQQRKLGGLVKSALGGGAHARQELRRLLRSLETATAELTSLVHTMGDRL